MRQTGFMGIKEKTLSLFEDSCRNSERGLKTICEAEKYLQQAYEGRYFFELIQNVRDANKEASQEGDIYIELKDKCTVNSKHRCSFQ